MALSAAFGGAAAADAPFDAAAEWDRFLATANASTVFGAYAVLDQLSYDGSSVDADACRANADALAQSIAAAPISLAIRRADYLCAQATGDVERAEQAITVLSALSREALSHSPTDGADKPIRVLTPVDASALVLSSGMEVAYLYYPWVHPERYFPLAIAARDPESGIERHLAFDFIDVNYTIDREDPMRGFPILRNHLASGYIQSSAATNQVFGLDAQAVAKASGESGDQRLATLREGAEAGGVESVHWWLVVCSAQRSAHCADGMIDALLPRAEKHQAYPLLLLSMAYLQGIGVERDPDKAWILLDAADRHWEGGGAIEQFTRILYDMDDKASLPAPLVERLQHATGHAQRYWRWLQIDQVLADDPKASLDAAQIAFLSDPASNEAGGGEAKLADWYGDRGDDSQMLALMRKAAAHGNAGAQAYYGYMLNTGKHGLEVDHDAARQMLESAAQGGSADAMGDLAYMAEDDSRWADAEAWLLQAAAADDVYALMHLARLYVDEHPGLRATQEQGVGIYRNLDRAGYARARRALASLALEGRGMKKDPEQARRWLLQDAEKGDHDSETQLGVALLKGEFGKPDEAEGLKWLKRAIEGGDVDAQNSYASWLYRKKTPESRRQAIEAWKKAIELGNETSSNNLAWYQCVSPDPAVRDPKAGLDVIEALAKTGELGSGAMDTEAACYAANGDYARAAKLQEDVIAKVKRRNPDDPDALKQFLQRRDLYAAGKPYVLDEAND
ncbi:sel1 repeat family protein [Pseudoluteimonas lycopersici]|uniref:Sel1 repeat family protein n=1 Tax=Pseudoluteimonas lycopersici TaxID=1324796 RepID=A0A516V531_9GAMM|nr:SEL1-like repeat protein [Lysobacter lycopersici]QDQ73633.1 sel1 repeat family protein [Lysobacter lycopersici]